MAVMHVDLLAVMSLLRLEELSSTQGTGSPVLSTSKALPSLSSGLCQVVVNTVARPGFARAPAMQLVVTSSLQGLL